MFYYAFKRLTLHELSKSFMLFLRLKLILLCGELRDFTLMILLSLRAPPFVSIFEHLRILQHSFNTDIFKSLKRVNPVLHDLFFSSFF